MLFFFYAVFLWLFVWYNLLYSSELLLIDNSIYFIFYLILRHVKFSVIQNIQICFTPKFKFLKAKILKCLCGKMSLLPNISIYSSALKKDTLLPQYFIKSRLGFEELPFSLEKILFVFCYLSTKFLFPKTSHQKFLAIFLPWDHWYLSLRCVGHFEK